MKQLVAVTMLAVSLLVIAYTTGCGENGTATPPPVAPTVVLTASANSITEGESVTLSWATNNATSVSSTWGSTLFDGTASVSPTADTTYTITATGPGGTRSQSVTITVTPAAPVQAIVPGDSAGDILLGADYTDIVATIGAPDTTADFLIWIEAQWADEGYDVFFIDNNSNGVLDAGDLVEDFFLDPPFAGQTEEGIGIGSTRAEVHAALGDPELVDEEGWDSYASLGIDFKYDGTELTSTVTSIYVYTPAVGLEFSKGDSARTQKKQRH